MSKKDQNICIKCGFCCDGTLFGYANIKESEPLETAYSFEVNTDNRRAFKQPCSYLHNKVCSIYRERPYSICSTYHCKLLKAFESGKVSYEGAMRIINQAIDLRGKIENQVLKHHLDNKGNSIRRKIKAFDEHFAGTMSEEEYRKKFGRIILDKFTLKKILLESFTGKKENIE